MRRKEIAEIRKQFSLENCNITRIDTTLITQGENYDTAAADFFESGRR